MYATCLFCHHPLGSNEVLETFPVGRRLAFDAVRGRLWVVCRRCERWNLSPLEERWEAIEECERRFHDTKLRVSTENIGLTRLREGLELVRIGSPQRPEFAAWRYGDQFGRRRVRTVLKVGAGLGVIGGIVAGGAALGVGVGGFAWMIGNWGRLVVKGNPRTVVARIALDDGSTMPVRRRDLEKAALRTSSSASGWELDLSPRSRRGPVASRAGAVLHGDRARIAAGQLLPSLNRFGASRSQVADAVTLIERAATPYGVFAEAARQPSIPATLSEMPVAVRIALEMAAHEESERRALEGELQELEQAWREAEEVAAIADNLLVPRGFDELLSRVRGGAR